MQHLIVLRGPIGAGKTTIAKTICERHGSFSNIELDGLKRMIYPKGAPEWRRGIAVQTGAFMAELLLQNNRSVVTETPTLWPNQREAFERVAGAIPNVIFSSFLIVAPLEVCEQRSAQRVVPDMHYHIGRDMLEDYYANLDPLPGERVFNTTEYSAEGVAVSILHSIADCARDKQMSNET